MYVCFTRLDIDDKLFFYSVKANCSGVFFFHTATVLQNRRHLLAGVSATQLVLRVPFWFPTLLSDASGTARVSLKTPEIGPQIESEMSVRRSHSDQSSGISVDGVPYWLKNSVWWALGIVCFETRNRKA
jgi:hypothetical protein